MIHFIAGKPGGGKSLYAMRLILDELRLTRRPIVTNIAVNFDGLQARVEQLVPGWSERGVHVRERIRLLTDDELVRFFCFRGLDGSEDVEYVSGEQWSSGKRMQYNSQTHGVFYVLDEVHIAFGARQWSQTGAQVLYYLSQHRKLGDDIVCVTQHVENVDKQFRTMAQDFTYLRNMAKVKMGFFAMPSIFVRRTFLSPAVRNDKPVETGTFTLDVDGLGACYNTAAGVGILGRSADTGQKARGLPWWMAVVCVVVLLGSIFVFVPRALSAWVSKPFRQPAIAVSAQSPKPQPVQVNPPRSVQAVAQPVFADTNVVYVTGYIIMRGCVSVALSDGRMFSGNDPSLQSVNPSGAIIAGKFYPIAQQPRLSNLDYSQPDSVNAGTWNETPRQFKGRAPAVFHWN